VRLSHPCTCTVSKQPKTSNYFPLASGTDSAEWRYITLKFYDIIVTD